MLQNGRERGKLSFTPTKGGGFLAMLMWGEDTTSDFLAVLKGVGDVQSLYHFTGGGGDIRSCTVSQGVQEQTVFDLRFSDFCCLFSP